MKSRSHTRLENDETEETEAHPVDKENKGSQRMGDGKTLIKLNDSLNETF